MDKRYLSLHQSEVNQDVIDQTMMALGRTGMQGNQVFQNANTTAEFARISGLNINDVTKMTGTLGTTGGMSPESNFSTLW